MKGREGTKNNFNSENSYGGLVHKLVHTPAFQAGSQAGSQLVHKTSVHEGTKDKVTNYEEQSHKAKTSSQSSEMR